LVLAGPVASPEMLAHFRKEADEAICLETPLMFGAIGLYYRDFHQMSDEEVTDLLARAAEVTSEAPPQRISPERCSEGLMAEATNAAADCNVIVTLPEATFHQARKFPRR